jgi:hypothetical protein
MLFSISNAIADTYVMIQYLLWEVEFCMSQEGNYESYYRHLTYLARRFGLYRESGFVQQFLIMMETRNGFAGTASRGTGELLPHLYPYFGVETISTSTTFSIYYLQLFEVTKHLD